MALAGVVVRQARPTGADYPPDVDGLSLAISARIDRKQKLRAVRLAMENSWLATPG